MPSGAQLLLPAALPAAAALLTWTAGAAGLRLGRVPAAAAAWLTLALLAATWLPERSVLELHGRQLGSGSAFGLRLDALSFVFCLAVVMPAAMLLTFQRRGWRESGTAALTLSAGLLAVLADGVVLSALALGTATTLLFVQLRSDHERGTESYWPAAVAGSTCLVWFGATLEVITQTSVYTAVPVTGLGTAGFLLLAAAALLISGLLPWRPWTAEMWDRPRLPSGALAAAVLFPLGPLMLMRAYEVGGGRWPSLWLNFALAVVGAATALAAAVRAQSAPTRRAVVSESLPGLGGVALTAFALGTPAGAVAGMTAVLAAALVAAVLPLIPDEAGLGPAAALALAAGVPPSLTFVARLLTVEAAIEAGDAWAFLGIILALGWLVSAAACARALRLPPLGRGAEAGGSRRGALLGAAIALGAGVLAGVTVTYLLLPAVLEVMTLPVAAVAGGRLTVTTVAGTWSAVPLGAPAAVVFIALVVAARVWPAPVDESSRPAATGPLLDLPAPAWSGRAWDRLAQVRVPEQYRSLADPRALEAAMARGQPVLWAVLVLVLAVAINR